MQEHRSDLMEQRTVKIKPPQEEEGRLRGVLRVERGSPQQDHFHNPRIGVELEAAESERS